MCAILHISHLHIPDIKGVKLASVVIFAWPCTVYTAFKDPSIVVIVAWPCTVYTAFKDPSIVVIVAWPCTVYTAFKDPSIVVIVAWPLQFTQHSKILQLL